MILKNQKYGPLTLDRIAELWAKRTPVKEIGFSLGIPKNSVCRLVFNARLAGDLRFPVHNDRNKRSKAQKPLTPEQHPTLNQLPAHGCRYPVWSGTRPGEHRFCGKPQQELSSYCPEHARLCRGNGN